MSGKRKYVTPNQEHRGLGAAIRSERKDNLLQARQKRLAAYRDRERKNKKSPQVNFKVSGYGKAIFQGSNRLLDGLEKRKNLKKGNFMLPTELSPVEAVQEKLLNSSKELCRN